MGLRGWTFWGYYGKVKMKLFTDLSIWYQGLGPAMKFGVTGILAASVIFGILGAYSYALAGIGSVALHFGWTIQD